jgi:hypothetical protein
MPPMYLLALLGLLVAGLERAEAFGYGYWTNGPVDGGYHSPAWDSMAAYYNSRPTTGADAMATVAEDRMGFAV